MLAVPVPVGGRVLAMGVDCAGGCVCVLAGVVVVCAGFDVTVALIGPVGTPATGLSSANPL